MLHEQFLAKAAPAQQPRRSALHFACAGLLTLSLAGCGGFTLTKGSTEATTGAVSLPTITAQPANATVTAGQTATFSLTAAGEGSMTYQWQLNSANISGATAATYTTPAVASAQNGALYSVVVTNAAGSVTSSAATLSVLNPQPPAIESQPQSQSVGLGSSATFSVTASGTGPLSYQWQINSINIAGATGASYTTPAAASSDTGSIVTVVVSNALGSIDSNAATLMVDPSAAQSYFVAVNGSDNADGSQASPFATLQRAQVAMQQSSIKITQINAGTYYLTTPLALTHLDQGETWKPVPGATVILSGGQVLTGWSSEGNGIYSASAPNPVGLDLSIAGVRQTSAALGYDPQRPFITGWRVLSPNQPQLLGTTFIAQPGDVTSSVKPGAIIQTIDSLRYTDNFTTVVSVDPSNNSITVADRFYTGTNQPGVSGSWRVLNDPADLGAPAEFAYDAATGKAYVEPANPESLATDTVIAARLSTLISMNQVSGVTITGLTFSDTTSDKGSYSGAFGDKLATIMGQGLSNSTFSGNTFLNVGNGISLSGSSANTITGNNFNQLGGSGIFLTTNSNNNNVTDNTLTGMGKINVGSTGIHLENSANNVIDRNTIDGSGRWGIDLFPTDGVSLVGNTVSNNMVRNTSQQTNDTSPIYSYAGNNPTYTMESTTITGNRLENIGGLLRDASGNYKLGQTQGIYMDDQVSGVTMTKNVIESNGNGIFLCHGCKANSATNNVVALQPAAFYDRGANGVTYSTGDMTYDGVTRVDLLPSYFPANLTTTTIVVQLSGQSSSGMPAAFNLQADGAVIGSGTASSTVAGYVFTAQLTPHQIHRIAIGLTNGAIAGASTTALHNLVLFVNNTAVQLNDPEAQGADGAYGFVSGNDNLQVTNFSATQNIVYRNGGLSQNLMDWTDWTNASYLDPNPGSIDDNVLFQNVTKASDTVFGSQPLDAHSVLADPEFTNPQSGDYTLLPNSPARGLGFSVEDAPLAPNSL